MSEIKGQSVLREEVIGETERDLEGDDGEEANEQ